MDKIEKVESEVPFGHSIYAWLYLRDLRLEKLVKHDQVEQHYLAWETVRKQINPYFLEGTGFEGYLVGRCETPEAALESILAINKNILDAIARLYPHQYTFHSRLMKTLMRETSDSEAIHVWSAYLGAELGRLRAQIIGNPEAEKFQMHTYKIVNTLPSMNYHEIGDDVTQTYAVGSDGIAQPNKLSITLQMLPSRQQDAWLVAQNIGEFGHPLVRKFLDHVPGAA